MNDNTLTAFIEKLTIAVNNKELIKLLLSDKRDKGSDLKNIIVTIVKLKAGYSLNFVYRHQTKDITKNYPEKEGISLIQEAINQSFLCAQIYSKSEDITLQVKHNGKMSLKVANSSLDSNISFNHDKTKERLISTQNNIYLRELGLVNANWEIRREMNDKYKQINKYIDLMKPYLTRVLDNGCQIADMGSGKGYLTFALYDYITNSLQKNTTVTGVEMRPDLIDTCNKIAEKAHFENLNFKQGTIKDAPFNSIDILIALHACDTATDDAIYRGIISKSALIVCAPCCHKQIRREFNVTSPLGNVTKFGILEERQAEIITDTIRALLMEAFGYKTNVFEFISTEHTPKNVMIVGEKRANKNPNKEKILAEIDAIKKIYGIKKHYLEVLLNS
jgi:Methylase of polypeptide chain release factors